MIRIFPPKNMNKNWQENSNQIFLIIFKLIGPCEITLTVNDGNLDGQNKLERER